MRIRLARRGARAPQPTPAPIRVRPLDAGDVDAVLGLWSAYVTEGFADNFRGEPGELDEQMSLDRWGPGVAVRMVEIGDAPPMPMGKEPSVAVREHLERMVGHPLQRCLVAEHQTTLVGFVTLLVQELPTQDARVGHIVELYVEPGSRRTGVGSALVEAALEELRRAQVGIFRANVPTSRASRGARGFWKAARWDNDFTVFSLYD